MKLFLNEEDEKDVKNFIKDLSKKKYKTNDSIESGGLGVQKEIMTEGTNFIIYRVIGYVFKKRKSPP